MGEYISLAVSNSVSKKEWIQAYEETLRFIKIFQLAEGRWANVKGIDVYCRGPTTEKEEETAWWLGKNARLIGWTASGDYETSRLQIVFRYFGIMLRVTCMIRRPGMPCLGR